MCVHGIVFFFPNILGSRSQLAGNTLHFAHATLEMIQADITVTNQTCREYEPVWPSGKALVRLVSGRGRFDSPNRLSFFFKDCGLWTLSYYFATHS